MTDDEHHELDLERLSELLVIIQGERESVQYPYIPEQLWKYCEEAIDKNKTDDSLLVAVDRRGVGVIFSDLNERFKRACKITLCDINQLFAALDFSPKDVDKGRIDSFLAEVRALAFLNDKGFFGHQPLKRRKKKKQCDIVATWNSRKFAVEVFHSAQPSDPKVYCDSEFVDELCNRFKDKRCQLDTSINEFKCERGLIIYVLDSFAPHALTSKDRFTNNLECVSNKLSWGEQYHFAIVTGCVAKGPLQDTIFPPLEIV